MRKIYLHKKFDSFYCSIHKSQNIFLYTQKEYQIILNLLLKKLTTIPKRHYILPHH